MASQVAGYIGKLNPGNGTEYSLGSTAYGVCETAANIATKVVDMTGFTLTTGATIFVKFTNGNSSATPKLNVNETGEKWIVQYGWTYAQNWTAGEVLSLTYNGSNWVRDQGTLSTQFLVRPTQLHGLKDNTLQTLVSTARANRLAFLPASQVIIEKTTDGGTTWVDAEISDTDKAKLFAELRPSSISLPLLNGVRNENCGLRITFTAMKYNVPAGTAETAKYNYWNSTYVISGERYCNLTEFYFWVSSINDGIKIIAERATGADSTTWQQIFNNDEWAATGWSAGDYIRFTEGSFGGGRTQTDRYWNYRLTFFTRDKYGTTSSFATTYTTNVQSIYEIRGYGDGVYTSANSYMGNDHLYSFDVNQNATFPATVTATTFIGSLQGNASTADKVNKDLVLKIQSGSTEGTNLYTFNGSAAKTLNIKAGNNVTLTAAAGELTIAATDTTYSAMSVAEMKTGTATTGRVMRADYLKSFLSTLGGTYLTLTYDATNGLILNHNTSGVTAGTYGSATQVPKITVDAQGHITGVTATTITNSRDPGYGKIKAGTASTATTAITANTSTAEASTYNETLTINPGNKWIAVAANNSSTAGSDTFTIAHSTSGATAGNYGDNSNQTPAYGGTFNVPYISIDAGGHVTGISTHTVQIPASDNTDYKVRQMNDASTNADYRLLLSNSANNTQEDNISRKNANLIYNPSTNKLSTGNLDLTNALDVAGKANFVQSPTAPTPASGDNSTKLATTEFVKTSVAGLSGAMHFRGTTTSAIVDGSTTNPIVIGGSNYTAAAGDVVLKENTSGNIFEYVWTGSAWEMLGRDDNFKVAQTAIDTGSAATNKWVSRIQQNTNGDITATMGTLDTSGTWNGTAKTATGAQQLLAWSGNETAIGATATPANATNSSVWINYRSGYGGSASDGATQLTAYYFGNRKGTTTGVTLYAEKFSGNAATATSASKLQNTSKIGDTNKPVYFTANGVPAVISYTINKSVPSDAVFTDTLVTQTPTTTNANYELLFSATADNTARTETTRKNSNLIFNPSTGRMTVTGSSGASGEYIAQRGATSMFMGFGGGDSNHGLYSWVKNDWMIYSDSNGDVIVNGNAATATKLATSKTINGTSFDGSANITTDNWGTARTITIGATGKSVNGSANVSWSLAEINGSTAVGGTTQPIYWTGSAFSATTYSLSATVSAGTANQVAYYSGTNTISAKAPAWSAWTAGTTAGPKANIQIGNATYTSAAIPSATATASGIVTTGNQTFKGIKTFYNEGTTANNVAAGIQFSNKDTTTGQTYSTAYIYAYQDHATTTYGTNMVIKSGGNLFLGSGESPSNLYSAIINNFQTSENLYMTADETAYLYANANTIADRVGLAITTDGNLIPQKAESINNNVQSLGASNNRWSQVYIGTADSYGSTTQPIYWNAGVPTAITGAIANNTTGNAATATKLGTSTVGSATQPIYLNNGTATATTYSLNATVSSSANANRIAYYSGANTISAATNHVYGPNTYLIQNTAGGTTIGFQVKGKTYQLQFIIGSGDTNRGIYDQNDWWFYRDNTRTYIKNATQVSTRLGVNGYNSSYTFYVNGTSYSTGYLLTGTHLYFGYAQASSASYNISTYYNSTPYPILQNPQDNGNINLNACTGYLQLGSNTTHTKGIVLTSNSYGSTLPSTNKTTGRIFFKI